ncbi:hypothetical protein EVAR_57379_1 [Eumeta japonica]|uniref:Uncharacterized protein n=1 Tax=Eumeta variegata TaxID=151549 RepID=A0A4C1ZEP4_EUMVA|nr:hypothetical protein EVAR_57379_1 [Eumeta japonica]
MKSGTRRSFTCFRVAEAGAPASLRQLVPQLKQTQWPRSGDRRRAPTTAGARRTLSLDSLSSVSRPAKTKLDAIKTIWRTRTKEPAGSQKTTATRRWKRTDREKGAIPRSVDRAPNYNKILVDQSARTRRPSRGRRRRYYI